MGNTALTRAFFICIPRLTKDEEITPKALNFITWGKKPELPSLYSAKRRKPALSCTRYKNVCILRVILCQACVPVWEFCLQKSCWDCSSKSIQAYWPPCPSQEFWLLGLPFVTGKSEKSSQRSNRIRIPLSRFVAEKEKGLIQSSKNWTGPQTNPCYTHKTNAFLATGTEIFKPAVFNRI